MYFRRYNVHTGMNANQKMFIYIPKFADKIRKITKRNFFLNYSDFSDNEKDKGVLERVVAESVMCIFHFDKWNKNGKKLATYLNENSSEEEFDTLNNNIERLENIVTEDTKTLFNSKDCFIWLTLFNKFTKTGLDDSKFGEFLVAFVGGLRNKFVKGKLFDKVDEVGSTKDKRVIEDKLHILESLMKEYLHIEDAKPLSDVEFISQNVDIPIADVIEDIQLYMDTLDELEEDHIRVGSKLLHNENRQSMLAIVAYAYKNDIDLEEWMEEYASNNNTYFVDQKKNYLHMVEDVTAYNKRKAVA